MNKLFFQSRNKFFLNNFKYSKFLLILAISVWLGFLILLSDGAVESNDLNVYRAHYYCLKYDFDSILNCKAEIGSGVDFIYDLTAYVFRFFVGFDFFLFLISVFIYFSILLFIARKSKNFFISLVFVLSDFRFYELGNNVLRNGLAMSLVLLMLNNFNHSVLKHKFYMAFFPSLAHLSAAPLAFGGMKLLSKKKYIGILVLFFLGRHYFFEILEGVQLFIGGDLINKLIAYKTMFMESNDDSMISFPLHYLLILAVFYFFVGARAGDDSVLYFNLCFIMLCFSLLFDVVNVGYRFVNFSFPFVSLMLAAVVNCVKDRIVVDFYRSINLLIYFFISLIFFKNLNLIARAF